MNLFFFLKLISEFSFLSNVITAGEPSLALWDILKLKVLSLIKDLFIYFWSY